MSLTKLHRINALFLAVFLVLHLGNHLTVLFGLETHLAVLRALRQLYRIGVIEYALFTLFAAQILLGLALVFRRGRPKTGWAWLQVVSGGYLAFFLLQHLGAVIATRLTYAEIDTDTYWAASVVSQAPFARYFAPYYLLAIAALFTHVAAALRFRVWPAPARAWHRVLPFVGAALGGLIVTGLIFHAAPGLPPAYQAYLDNFWGTGR